MNQRRHLLELARKGDQKAVHQLMELYQVRVYSGDSLKSLKIRKSLPVLSPLKSKEPTAPSKPKPVKRHKVVAKKPKATPTVTRPAASKAGSASPKPSRSKRNVSPEIQTKSPKPARKPKAIRKAQPSPKKVSRTISSQGPAKKKGTRKPTAKPLVKPRTQAKVQPKIKPKTQLKAKPQAKTQATKKAKLTPASKAKRSR
ncbi:MAG: hypothetical protein OXB94_03170 [Nitrospira sp.]|nr:hypothetical protein [Nitrospira sp.]